MVAQYCCDSDLRWLSTVVAVVAHTSYFVCATTVIGSKRSDFRYVAMLTDL